MLPGIAFMAVNHQIYLEASTILYSSNTFLLPFGPCDEATTYFSFLAPSHRAQIRHLAIRFSVADITPSVLAQLDIGAKAARSYRTPRSYGNEVAQCLSWMWIMKMTWALAFHAEQIRAGAQGLETLTFEGYGSENVVMKGTDLPRTLPPLGVIGAKMPLRSWDLQAVLDIFDPRVRGCWACVLRFAHRLVWSMVLRWGWPRTRCRLEIGVKEMFM